MDNSGSSGRWKCNQSEPIDLGYGVTKITWEEWDSNKGFICDGAVSSIDEDYKVRDCEAYYFQGQQISQLEAVARIISGKAVEAEAARQCNEAIELYNTANNLSGQAQIDRRNEAINALDRAIRLNPSNKYQIIFIVNYFHHLFYNPNYKKSISIFINC